MFEKFKFTEKQIKNYYKSAVKDFKIAYQSDIPEVTFKFCYDVLLKLAIAVCAKNNLRVKARKGHHIELIKKLSDFLNDRDIMVIGNEMRSKRNWDLYSGGIIISEKEAKEYRKWIKAIILKVKDYLNKNFRFL